MPALNPQDPFLIDTLLNEDERLLRDATREFVQSELEPVVTQAARDGHFPRELAPKMGEMGLFGLPLEGYGCLGLGYVSYGLVNYEVEYCDSAFRSFLSVQSSLVMHPIILLGLKNKNKSTSLNLPAVNSSDVLGSQNLTQAQTLPLCAQTLKR